MVRTRFAPSPTGQMHVGGVRTALFAWALARNQNGKFILRIEDTDKSREIEGSVEHIVESLDWLGLDRDEGPILQSERLEVYKKYAQGLIDQGLAYAEPYTSEELDGLRQQAKDNKQAFLFRNHRPEKLETPDDWYENVAIRFKVPEIKRYSWHDEVWGDLSAGEDSLDDFIIMKADGYPTYNFAHVIDDHEMRISHVIRGEEFISSMPKFLSLHEALDFDWPKFVTVPLILNKEGGKKLSKRAGARDVLAYREQGYLPDAIANFIASMGWNDGTEQEIFTLEEIKQKFSVERIQKSGARFDETKLEWMQWEHSKRRLKTDTAGYLASLGVKSSRGDDYLKRAAALAAGKAGSLDEFKTQMLIFTEPSEVEVSDEWLLSIDKSLDKSTAKKYLEAAKRKLEVSEFSDEAIEESLRGLLEELNAKPRALLNLVRWSVSGSKVSPGLFEMIALLGKKETKVRIDKVLERLSDA